MLRADRAPAAARLAPIMGGMHHAAARRASRAGRRIGGWDRLGMVYEARGENREAADCYRKVIAFMREHPDNYDPAFEDKFVKLVAKLDPPSPA